MTEDCEFELHAAPPSEEIVQCARHCTKVLASLADHSVDAVFTAISLMLVNVVSNCDWPSQYSRDQVPDLIAEQLRRNLALVDAYDRSTGGNAD